MFGFLVTALTALVLRRVPWVLPTWLTEDGAHYLSSMPETVGKVVNWCTSGPFLLSVAIVFAGAAAVCFVCGDLASLRRVLGHNPLATTQRRERRTIGQQTRGSPYNRPNESVCRSRPAPGERIGFTVLLLLDRATLLDWGTGMKILATP
jgi:hypothetical protein